MGPERAGSRLRPRKSLGQNFLRDQNTARKIVWAIVPEKSDIIIEIGPGEGALTEFLAGNVRQLILVELDPRAVDFLQGKFSTDALRIVQGDFLEYDLEEAARQSGTRVRIVGNIPYNITSPILFHILDHRHAVKDATLMVQREVARRLVADRVVDQVEGRRRWARHGLARTGALRPTRGADEDHQQGDGGGRVATIQHLQDSFAVESGTHRAPVP